MEKELYKLIENGRFYIVDYENQDELYGFLAEELKKERMVKDSFLEALKKREAEYPTGIVNKLYNIALPHVDSEHVLTNSLIICKPKKYIKYNRMDKIDDVIDVKVIFLLLIKDKDIHIKALVNLTKIWTNEDVMRSLLEINDFESFKELLENSFK